ncbi:MAG TPA: M56 family metallopeptidase [Asticcacaulis sp.]|nr:M56 family metallopeptidase [Asticcacaulis sp.]
MNTHLTALGLTLLHVGWQALLVAALYRLCELCLTRLSDRARYRLGLAAMMTVLALALATFVYEEVRLANTPMPTSAALATPVMAPQILTQLTPWLDLAWALGVALLSLRLIGGLWFIARLPRAARPADPALTRRFETMAAALGLGGKVALRLHPRIDGPFVTGVLRSVVYLPLSAVTMLTPAQLDAVLSHELEHVLRRDYAWNLAQSLVEILFFFHPAVWWLGSRLREQRELICDDAALLACRDPLVYATALLQLEEGRRQAAPAAPRLAPSLAPSLAIPLNGHRRNLFWRIARMLDEETGEHPSSSRLLRAAGAVLALPLAVALLAAFAPPVAQTVARTAENLAHQPKESQPKEKVKDAPKDDKDCPPTVVKDVEIDAKDVIDADAVAEQARQAVLAAKADFKIRIDADKIAAEARQAAQAERDAQIKAGHFDVDIDPDAIAQQARSEAVKAQIEAAKSAVASIDVDKIAAQMRVEVKKSQVEIRRAKAEAAKVKTYKWVIQMDVPTPPESPAPLAEVAPPAPPTPPAPPAPQPARPALPPDIDVTIPAVPPAPAAPKVAAPAPPAPPARPAASALPAAKASALPAPKSGEDRIVILASR